MRTPTKSELYARISSLEKENIKLHEQLNAQKQRYWLDHQGDARRALFESVPFTVLQNRKLMLDHVDNTGYWFTFSVDKDETRQTYCVRHTDLADKSSGGTYEAF